MLKGATKKLRGKNVEIILGDLTKLKYKDDYFDSINLANSFHTIKDIDLAIHELTRVLKPHGQLATNILLEPKTFGFLDKISRLINKWGRKKGILYKAYLESEIYEIINKESQLAIESIQTKGNALYLTLIKKG
jgi:ubiquinone/menaquinone biosynthesis C-methylase UbiE